MFDENFAVRNFCGWFRIGCERRRHPSPVNPDVEIARRSDPHLRDAFDIANLPANCLCDLQRSRPQGLGKRKNRNRKVAEFYLWRLFDYDVGQNGARIATLKTLQHALGKTMFQMKIQEVPLSD